ncbi:GDSL esterase/lipase [Senna tora]|uniref:GDSL esterase/lipase n=1 Tax=Senna tora TaxID=362788 RepID=A0A834WLA8_9FABA|nr:GDSL esterase/lipase [Senna tora]
MAVALVVAAALVSFNILSTKVTACPYTSIFSFGDSIADTGNLYFSSQPPPLNRCFCPPYGQTYFGHSTGRCSDGRLIIDFIAESLGIPLVKPYLGIKNGEVKNWKTEEGVNFAVIGATALDVDFFEEKGIHNVPVNDSLTIQLGWFKELLPSLCSSSSSRCKKVLRNSLFLVGEIGGNDFNYLLYLRKSLADLETYVPFVINAISSAVSPSRTSHAFLPLPALTSHESRVTPFFLFQPSRRHAVTHVARLGLMPLPVPLPLPALGLTPFFLFQPSCSRRTPRPHAHASRLDTRQSPTHRDRLTVIPICRVASRSVPPFKFQFRSLFSLLRFRDRELSPSLSFAFVFSCWFYALSSDSVTELINLGAETLMVPGNFPLGCNAIYLTMYESQDKEDYDEAGCLKWLNNFAEYYNERLKAELNHLQMLHPNINIIYADYYNAALPLYHSPTKYGFTGLKACCGSEGPYNWNGSEACGNGVVSACDDPSKYISWDGLHLTEAAYRWIAKALLNAPYAFPIPTFDWLVTSSSVIQTGEPEAARASIEALMDPSGLVVWVVPEDIVATNCYVVLVGKLEHGISNGVVLFALCGCVGEDVVVYGTAKWEACLLLLKGYGCIWQGIASLVNCLD